MIECTQLAEPSTGPAHNVWQSIVGSPGRTLPPTIDQKICHPARALLTWPPPMQEIDTIIQPLILGTGSLRSLLDEPPDVEGRELLAASLVELALELHPMQTQSVQETLEDIHPQENAQCDAEPRREHQVDHDAIRREAHHQAHLQRLLEEHQGQLLVRQGQCPNTQVRGCVGDGPQNVLDGLDDLVDENLAELELL